ncbi:MAG: DUF1275 domain-containing protein [Chloroflexi bacterium]|nr:DUF1275 domain-containing protein [Chloroflexota bacterium]
MILAPRPLPGQATMVALLACTGGYVDAASYFIFDRVFSAAMTGNTVLIALGIVSQDWSAALRSGIALGAFILGVAVAQAIVSHTPDHTEWPCAAGFGVLLELLTLAGLAIGWYLAGPEVSNNARRLLIAATALAMGIQSVAVLHLRVPAVATTYVTGTLVVMTAGFVDRLHRAARSGRPDISTGADPGVATPERRRIDGTADRGSNGYDQSTTWALSLAMVTWTSYLIGAIAGGLMVTYARGTMSLPPFVAVVVVFAIDVLAHRRLHVPAGSANLTSDRR